MDWLKIAVYTEPGRMGSLYSCGPCLKTVCKYMSRSGKHRIETTYICHDQEFATEGLLSKYLDKVAGCV